MEYKMKKNKNLVIIAGFGQEKKWLQAYINMHKEKQLNKIYLNKVEAKKVCVKDEKEKSKTEKQF